MEVPGSLTQAWLAGQVVQAHFSDRRGMERTQTASVESVGADSLLLRLPAGPSPLAELPPQRDLQLVVHQENTTAVGLARVLGHPASDLLHTTIPAQLHRTTERRMFRVAVSLPVRTSRGPGRILDLSGCGCLLRLEGATPPLPGQVLELSLPLPGSPDPLEIRCRVVRLSRRAHQRPHVALEFQHSRRVADTVARYVHLREREMLRRGSAERPSGAEARRAPLLLVPSGGPERWAGRN